MANATLDPLFHSLFSTVVPVLIVCGIVGLLLGETFKWLERRAVRLGKTVRKTREMRQMQVDAAIAPHCPLCNSQMATER
ncbi:hypothetical protein BH20VER1_BH20VER1_24700 [soil metagenome]